MRDTSRSDTGPVGRSSRESAMVHFIIKTMAENFYQEHVAKAWENGEDAVIQFEYENKQLARDIWHSQDRPYEDYVNRPWGESAMIIQPTQDPLNMSSFFYYMFRAALGMYANANLPQQLTNGLRFAHVENYNRRQLFYYRYARLKSEERRYVEAISLLARLLHEKLIDDAYPFLKQIMNRAIINKNKRENANFELFPDVGVNLPFDEKEVKNMLPPESLELKFVNDDMQTYDNDYKKELIALYTQQWSDEQYEEWATKGLHAKNKLTPLPLDRQEFYLAVMNSFREAKNQSYIIGLAQYSFSPDTVQKIKTFLTQFDEIMTINKFNLWYWVIPDEKTNLVNTLQKYAQREGITLSNVSVLLPHYIEWVPEPSFTSEFGKQLAKELIKLPEINQDAIHLWAVLWSTHKIPESMNDALVLSFFTYDPNVLLQVHPDLIRWLKPKDQDTTVTLPDSKHQWFRSVVTLFNVNGRQFSPALGLELYRVLFPNSNPPLFSHFNVQLSEDSKAILEDIKNGTHVAYVQFCLKLLGPKHVALHLTLEQLRFIKAKATVQVDSEEHAQLLNNIFSNVTFKGPEKIAKLATAPKSVTPKELQDSFIKVFVQALRSNHLIQFEYENKKQVKDYMNAVQMRPYEAHTNLKWGQSVMILNPTEAGLQEQFFPFYYLFRHCLGVILSKEVSREISEAFGIISLKETNAAKNKDQILTDIYYSLMKKDVKGDLEAIFLVAALYANEWTDNPYSYLIRIYNRLDRTAAAEVDEKEEFRDKTYGAGVPYDDAFLQSQMLPKGVTISFTDATLQTHLDAYLTLLQKIHDVHYDSKEKLQWLYGAPDKFLIEGAPFAKFIIEVRNLITKQPESKSFLDGFVTYAFKPGPYVVLMYFVNPHPDTLKLMLYLLFKKYPNFVNRIMTESLHMKPLTHEDVLKAIKQKASDYKAEFEKEESPLLDENQLINLLFELPEVNQDIISLMAVLYKIKNE